MKHRPTIPFWVPLMNLLLSLAVLLLGLWVWILSSHGLPRTQLQALELVYHQIEKEAVEPPSREELMWQAIEGMVESVDHHSEFFRPSAVAQLEEDTTGNYVGVGIIMETADGTLRVRFPLEDGPADRAGILVGDRILSVNGEPVTGATPEELTERARSGLMGPAGMTVRVEIERNGETIEKVIERREVHKPSVKFVRMLDRERRIGYLYLKAFQDGSANEVRAALDQLAAEAGGQPSALILDLRFNRGGLLDEAVEIANLFVPAGRIVTLERRNEPERAHDAVAAHCTHPNTDVVLLVNSASASASEVVAGALRDHKRATLVGERTFGKGAVQSIYSWRDLDFRLKLTTARYRTPNGILIEKSEHLPDGEWVGGLAPDHAVSVDKATERELYGTLQNLNEPPRRYREAVLELAEQLDFPPPLPLGPDRDPQLAAALEQAVRTVEAPR